MAKLPNSLVLRPRVEALRKRLAELSKQINEVKAIEDTNSGDVAYARWMALHAAETSVDSAETALQAVVSLL